jgi:quercetin dioxygenase-like cupin family protein
MILEHCAGQAEVAVGPLFIRKIHLTAATPDVSAHTHPFGHVTFFMGGTVQVTLTNADGSSRTVKCGPGDWVHIPAGVEHSMHLLSSEAVCACVFANRNASGALIETFESLAPTQ